jgi:hypothetical protein
MKDHRALWYSAVAFFLIGLWSTATAASGAPFDGGSGFSWGQVCVLCAVAMAWGDMRAQVKDMRREIDEIKKRDED